MSQICHPFYCSNSNYYGYISSLDSHSQIVRSFQPPCPNCLLLSLISTSIPRHTNFHISLSGLLIVLVLFYHFVLTVVILIEYYPFLHYHWIRTQISMFLIHARNEYILEVNVSIQLFHWLWLLSFYHYHLSTFWSLPYICWTYWH